MSYGPVVATPALLSEHKITPDEYERIQAVLGREPNIVELGIFSALWSEHCSYKTSRVFLKEFPTKGPRVLQGPGENAGAVDIGEGLAVVFKMESHNHPSFIEPYQGAATGVGGILRDIFQQNIIALAETFSSDVDGRTLFPDYRTRRDQSVRLREDLWSLVVATVTYEKAPDKKSLKGLVDGLDTFRRGSMRFLMFKDWSLFERFQLGFSRERPARSFLPAAHQFEVFLRTLVREVGKRSVLVGVPFRGQRTTAAEPAASD